MSVQRVAIRISRHTRSEHRLAIEILLNKKRCNVSAPKERKERVNQRSYCYLQGSFRHPGPTEPALEMETSFPIPISIPRILNNSSVFS